MNRRAFITGISGPELSAAEREFIGMQRPWGFILFKRNIETPTQVISLVQELRKAVSDPEAPVLVDQEGGRVQRLGPPHWSLYPAGAVFGVLYDIDPALGLAAARLSARLIAADLMGLGVTVDCLPLADLPMAMTAHVVFSALDPAHPATTSATIVKQVIRGVIGFQGLLMSDDVSMNALAGSVAERTRAIFAAGCDVVLHCNGKLDEMREVAAETPELSGEALERATRALAMRKAPQAFDRVAARAELDALIVRAETAGA